MQGQWLFLMTLIFELELYDSREKDFLISLDSQNNILYPKNTEIFIAKAHRLRLKVCIPNNQSFLQTLTK